MTDDLNATDRSPSDPHPPTATAELVLFESAAFQRFDQWIDGELAQLVERWIATAAPNANRPRPERGRFGAEGQRRSGSSSLNQTSHAVRVARVVLAG